jgi:hypothetical protein
MFEQLTLGTSSLAEGKLMNDMTGKVRWDERGEPKGFIRTITVGMDTAQYQVHFYLSGLGTDAACFGGNTCRLPPLGCHP